MDKRGSRSTIIGLIILAVIIFLILIAIVSQKADIMLANII
jgi:uncharacterized membrane protein